MVDQLIGALSESIKDKFEDWRVYTESVYQALEKPCFFVECENLERVDMLNGNFLVRVKVKITCDNDSEEKKYEMQSIAADLFDILGRVRAGECFFNGRKINGRWEGGSFIIRACYDMFTKRATQEASLMETIELRGIGDGRDGIYEG